MSTPTQVTSVFTEVTSSTVIKVSWHNISPPENYRTYIWYNSNDGAWSRVSYVSGSTSSYNLTVAGGAKYGVKLCCVWKCEACDDKWVWADGTTDPVSASDPITNPSSWTTPVYRSIYSDSQTGGIAVSGSYTDTQYSGGTFCDGEIAVGGSYTDTLTCSNTYTGGIAVGGIYTDSLVTPVDYAYYIGTDDGIIYRFGTDYLGDKGLPITSTWESKTVDFSDLDPSLTGIKKTIYGITLFYEDKATSAPFTIYLSNDGGATWSSSTKTCGTTTNKVAEKTFFFVPTASSTGHYFKFRIEHASAAQEFKWLGLRVEFEPQGKYYALS